MAAACDVPREARVLWCGGSALRVHSVLLPPRGRRIGCH